MDGVVSDLLDLPEKLSKPFFADLKMNNKVINENLIKLLGQLTYDGGYEVAWMGFIGEGPFKEVSPSDTHKNLKKAAYRGSYPAWYVLAMIKVFVQEEKNEPKI